MEPILLKHGYKRAYKEGEKQHMPVEVYKRTMVEHDHIIDDAKKEAAKRIEEADKEVIAAYREKDELINGNPSISGTEDTDYEEWSLDDLKGIRKLYVHGDPHSKGIDSMSLEQLEKEYAIKMDQYKETVQQYNALVNGYVDSSGNKIMGYQQLLARHKTLLKEPERILETPEGQKVLEAAEKRITEKVFQKMMTSVMDFVQKYIFDVLKRYLVRPVYKAIDSSVDTVTSTLGIGNKVEEEIKNHLPDIQEVQEEVHQFIRRGRGR